MRACVLRRDGGDRPHLAVGDTKALTGKDIASVATFLQTFNAGKEATKERLRVVLRKLNAAMRRRDPVDSVIDLGIALETLFGGPEAGEHSYKVQIHAARFLGKSEEDRNRIRGIAKCAYHLRNKAVHSGRIPTQDIRRQLGRDATLTEVLSEAGDVVRHAACRIIEEGTEWPDWPKAMLAD